MKTNACELDAMPTKLLKELLPWVIELFTLLLNASLASKIFKSTWKTAIVRPLLKKQNASLELKNYRPVINLVFLSKVLEKLAMEKVITYCEEHKLLPSYQSAYRKFRSCETALLKLTNEISYGTWKTIK